MRVCIFISFRVRFVVRKKDYYIYRRMHQITSVFHIKHEYEKPVIKKIYDILLMNMHIYVFSGFCKFLKHAQGFVSLNLHTIEYDLVP